MGGTVNKNGAHNLGVVTGSLKGKGIDAATATA